MSDASRMARAVLLSSPFWALAAVSGGLAVYNAVDSRSEDGSLSSQAFFVGFWVVFSIAFVFLASRIYRQVRQAS